VRDFLLRVNLDASVSGWLSETGLQDGVLQALQNSTILEVEVVLPTSFAVNFGSLVSN
jgi:hypothetical protein